MKTIAFLIFTMVVSLCLGCTNLAPKQTSEASASRDWYYPPASQNTVADVYDETGDNYFFTPRPHCAVGNFTFSTGRIWWSSRIDRSDLSQSSDSRRYSDGDLTDLDHLLITIQVGYDGPEPAYLPRITIIDATPEPFADVLGKPQVQHEIEPESIGFSASDGASSVQRLSYGPAKVFVLPFAAIIGHKNLSIKFDDRAGRTAFLPLAIPEYHLERHSRY